MAALDFPASPTDGQVYGNWIYSTSKGAWQALPIPTGIAAQSPTAPVTPYAGDLWYNTNDGGLYTWYIDGDSSQWVEVKSDATLSSTLGNRVTALEAVPTGIVDLTPASVTVGSGTATVNSSGLITFTGASSVSINGIFTSAYSNYEIINTGMWGSVDNASPGFRYRAAGVDNSSSQYYMAGSAYQNSNGGVSGWGTGVGAGFDLGRWRTSSTTGSSQRFTVFNPAVASKQTQIYGGGFWENSSSPYGFTIAGVVNNTSSYDGFTLYASSGTFNGTIQVYGLR